MTKQQTEKTPRRPLFGTPVPMAACDAACCETLRPAQSGVATHARQTIRFGVPANDNALARVATQRAEVVRLTVAVLEAIEAWQRARDVETRAALRCMRTPELAQAARDAESRLIEAEELCAAAEATLTIFETTTEGTTR